MSLNEINVHDLRLRYEYSEHLRALAQHTFALVEHTSSELDAAGSVTVLVNNLTRESSGRPLSNDSMVRQISGWTPSEPQISIALQMGSFAFADAQCAAEKITHDLMASIRQQRQKERRVNRTGVRAAGEEAADSLRLE